MLLTSFVFFFFFNDTATTEIYTLSLHDALPIYSGNAVAAGRHCSRGPNPDRSTRSEEHTSELQSRLQLVCRLLLEKTKDERPERRLIFGQQDGFAAVRSYQRLGSLFFFFSVSAPPQIYPLSLPVPLPI